MPRCVGLDPSEGTASRRALGPLSHSICCVGLDPSEGTASYHSDGTDIGGVSVALGSTRVRVLQVINNAARVKTDCSCVGLDPSEGTASDNKARNQGRGSAGCVGLDPSEGTARCQ